MWLARVAAAAAGTFRGRLLTGRPARLATATGELELTGDGGTQAVLADERLRGADLEAAGELTSAGKLTVGPIHTRSLYVWKDGKRLMISYWCAVCSIRTFTPGVCMCCQDETALDLKEKFENTR